ncbi:MAG: hypothetical protein KDK39_16325 [Leptospiraceae bacterium]|nr:hypothetical protein [Leptospiraceae bacterium]
MQGCGPSGSQELATWDQGSIQRADLRRIMLLESGPDAANLASIEVQSQKIRQLALLNIVAEQAKAAKLETNPAAKEAGNTALQNLKAQQLNYTLKLKSQADDFTITMTELQFLQLNQNPGSPSRLPEIEDYRLKLNAEEIKDSEVEDFIQQKSEHGRYRWLGGYIEPLCLNCNPPPILGVPVHLLKSRLKTEPGKFVLFDLGNKLMLMRTVKSGAIPLAELGDYQLDYFRKTMRLAGHYASHADKADKAAAENASMAKDEAQLEQSNEQIARRMREEIIKNLPRIRVEQLRDELEFEWVLKDEAVWAKVLEKTTDPKTVLFTIKNRKYEAADLQKDLKAYGLQSEPSNALGNIMNGIIVPAVLLHHDPLFVESQKGSDFSWFQDLLTRQELNQLWFAQLETPSVTAAELQEFEKKQGAVAKNLNAEARSQMKQYLLQMKRQQAIQSSQEQLAQTHGLKIITESLKPNEL